MHWMFGKHTCVRVQFLRWSKSNLKTEIEWPSNHWTIVADLLILVSLLIKDDSIREASTGADPASKFRGGRDFRNIGSQVSQRLPYCKRDEAYFTTMLWPNNGWQNGLILRMLFSELYKIMVNKITFAGFMGGDRPLWIPPVSTTGILLIQICNKLLFVIVQYFQ